MNGRLSHNKHSVQAQTPDSLSHSTTRPKYKCLKLSPRVVVLSTRIHEVKAVRLWLVVACVSAVYVRVMLFFSFVEATSRFLGSCEKLWQVSLPWN